MNDMEDSGDISPASLAATESVRLFPLPRLVMFPHVVQPLHIFEPRYCELLEDSLASNRQLAMVLLSPGWGANYDASPPIASVACLGKIIAHERLPTGRHNILLRGLHRVSIQRELSTATAYRQAAVDRLEDFYPAQSASGRSIKQRHLLELARQLLPDSAALHDQLDDLLDSQASLGMLCDVFAFTLGFSPALQQRLLAEQNVDRRAEVLIEKLTWLACGSRGRKADVAPSPAPFRLN
jgi:Lon protease-like protein